MYNGISFEEIVQKLLPIEVFVLDELKDKTTPQLGISKDELLTNLKNIKTSIYKLSQSLMRLEFVNLVSSIKIGNTNYFYITENGLICLNILDNK